MLPMRGSPKKKKSADDHSFSNYDNEDAYNAPSKVLGWTGPEPAPGSFAACAKCAKQPIVVGSSDNLLHESGPMHCGRSIQ
jgi:hypothetical protein